MILVFANDAGGAEIVAAHIKKKLKPGTFRAFVGGPAIKIFRRMGVPAQRIPDDREAVARLIKRHKNSTMTLTAAPGWMSRREWHGLMESKKAGLKTALYFDSWQNYRKCLGYPKIGWKENIPDEIWVGDTYARALAKDIFSGLSRVRFVPNQYYKNVVKEYAEAKRALGTKRSDAALFVSTPLVGTEEALLLFLSSASSYPEIKRLIIRLHPSDHHNKYDALISPYRSTIHIEKSTNKDIVKDLVRSRVVFGAETVAMVLATLCDIRTICFVAKGYIPTIPFKKIRHIRLDKNAQKRFIEELQK